MITDIDKRHLQRCVELAAEAVAAGDRPFGSVLVSATGEVLQEDRNRIHSVEATYHPEIALARWAAQNMTEEQRAQAVVYTSGEHCPMCAAAHAWAGLGRIVYASSSQQLGQWMQEAGVTVPAAVNSLSINQVAPDIEVEGPVAGLDEQVKALHQQLW
ncbi:nucleoside deaminase [Psychrobacter sp. FDAARGOS_221]|uniref:nucleoside deaminase n=1 Tax=Psychrobacter sp. FDAARGOS_221 TaxID=1975705 RepID=UPI000BB52CBE|nr:nucleoside deaminase [Psychrobacter sp. FDAARGOS_221]PNK61284.1 nucleoside deaminase [Psychrobacter sp. FDAARGOS_221]